MNPAVDLTCTVPGFALGAVNRVTRTRTDPGGKGVNMARLLRQLGLPVTVTGFLGDDNARIFAQLFAELEIEDAFVRIPGETRIGIKILDPEQGSTTDINLPGLSPEPGHLAALQATLATLAHTAAIVIIGGSMPASVPPQAMAGLVGIIRAGGARAVVDTSGPALAQAIAAMPSLIKPNIQELGEYLGRTVHGMADIVAEARALLQRGIETVVVSLGAEGAVFVEDEAALWARPPRVEPVSTVGAGDAMVSGMCAGMALGLSLAERARMATAMSAAVVTQPGPHLQDVETARALEAHVVIESLEY